MDSSKLSSLNISRCIVKNYLMLQVNNIVEEVQEALRDGSLLNNPVKCAEYRSRLSGEYSYTVGRLEETRAKKAETWIELRKGQKSDTATDKVYDSTPMGLIEQRYKAQEKRIEKMMQGLNSIIKSAENEAINHY